MWDWLHLGLIFFVCHNFGLCDNNGQCPQGQKIEDYKCVFKSFVAFLAAEG